MANSSQFERRDTQVLGISTDARPTQTAYYMCLGPTVCYPIPLLSDFEPKGRVSRLYGVYDENTGTAKRSVIVIDKGGFVVFSRLYTSTIEAGITAGWEKYSGLNGLAIGLDHYGASAPGKDLANEFGFTAEKVEEKIRSHLDTLQ